MRWYRRLLGAVFVTVTLLGVLRVRAEPAPPPPAAAPASGAPAPATPASGTATPGEAAAPAPAAPDGRLGPDTEVKDPRQLEDAGRAWLADGDRDTARKLFEKAVDAQELKVYLKYGKTLREALVLELLGDFEGAGRLYREHAQKDVLYTVLVLRIASAHPDRDALVAEQIARVRAMAAAVEAGSTDQVIYVTSKGEPRYLEKVDAKDVLPRLRAVADGDDSKKLRYCYIDHLDLSGVDPATLPRRLQFSQCVIGSLKLPDLDIGQFVVSGFVLGDFDVGKTWEGEVNKSAAFPGSRFDDLTTRETVFLGRANFQDIAVRGRKAAFPLTVFEGPADFRGANLAAAADFRFSAFGADANFKGARLTRSALFGHARFRELTTFSGLYAERDVFFDSVRFEGPVRFDGCEWQRAATFENATFVGPLSFTASRVRGRLNLSRAVFQDVVDMREVALGGLDLFGAWLQGAARFTDARFDGKVRFSLDHVTRAHNLADPTPLLPLYRDYQGDEDAEEPLTRQSSYGVRHVDDLVARVDGDLSFANSVFGSFCVFDRVVFGQPGRAGLAEFYNTQFLGETHFERTVWWSGADFTTIQATELALNEAEIHDTLVLDDANVPGRITLTDARFVDDATLSLYGAEIGTLQIARDQVEGEDGARLWYQRCAEGDASLDDLRWSRAWLGEDARPDEDTIRSMCADRVIDEYVSLKQSFGDRAMTGDEDWAYWWIKHLETFLGLRYGGWMGALAFPLRFLIFELAFGWGVRLGNLAVTALVVCAAFTVTYKLWCPDAMMQYDGGEIQVREIPWTGVFYIALQSLGSFNTGWDFGDTDLRFKYLNTANTFIGVIILTFFVGAYTRMILA